VNDVQRFEADLLSFIENTHGDLLHSIREKKELPNDIKQTLDGVIKEFKQRFAAEQSTAAAKA
jgi:F-type H+/Na+-transporting ATPase subunit alpha